MMRFSLLLFSTILTKNIVLSDEKNYVNSNQLILTPFIITNQTSLAKNLSQVTFDDFENVVCYSGYFTVNLEYNSNLFFWFIQSENDHLKDPVVLWLHGGPGLPSEAGLFGESGPLSVKNGTLTSRNNSWTKTHSILYIDNPVGTGFSFTDNDDGYAVDQDQVGEELYKALIQFFLLFPELQTNDFFLVGGSYAGKYIPAVSNFIQNSNPTAKLKINLKGAIIYSGLVDPVNQLVYADFLHDRGLIDCHERTKLKVLEELITKYIRRRMYETSTILWNILMAEIRENPKVANLYNYLHNDDYYTLVPEWVPYVMLPEVRKKLHVGNTNFNFDITHPENKVRLYLGSDWSKSVSPWFENMVDNYPVLLFSGELDVMIPYTSLPNFIRKLNSSVADEFEKAETYLWRVDDIVAGECKSAGFLTECLVRDSGHSIPHEKDKYSYDLVYKFMRNLSLGKDDIDNNIITDNNI